MNSIYFHEGEIVFSQNRSTVYDISKIPPAKKKIDSEHHTPSELLIGIFTMFFFSQLVKSCGFAIIFLFIASRFNLYLQFASFSKK